MALPALPRHGCLVGMDLALLQHLRPLRVLANRLVYASSRSMYLYSTPAIACALTLAALTWRRVTPLLRRRGFVLGMSMLSVAGTALTAASPLLGGQICFAIGSVLTGLGTSVLALKTGEAFGTLGGREVLTAGTMALVFAAFLYFMGIGLPVVLRPAFIALMPPVSALLYIMPADDPFPADEHAISSLGSRAPGRSVGQEERRGRSHALPLPRGRFHRPRDVRRVHA